MKRLKSGRAIALTESSNNLSNKIDITILPNIYIIGGPNGSGKTTVSLRLLPDRIDAGVKAAIAQAIEKHRRLGQSIRIWRDGKIVTLTAAEIPPRADSDTAF